MKHLIYLITIVVIIVSLVVLGFTLRQVNQQRTYLTDDLQRRTSLLADSLKESIRPSYLNNATSSLQNVLNKFTGRERLLGLAVYDSKSSLYAVSLGLSPEYIKEKSPAELAMDSDSTKGDFFFF